MSGRITIKDVAREAGVSFSTAAAALRGERGVKPSTVEKVTLTAQRLGYERSTFASMLASRRQSVQRSTSPFVGWLTIGFGEHSGIQQRIARVRKAAHARRWLFEHRDIQSEPEARRLGREWKQRGVDAVVLGRSVHLHRESSFPWHDFVVVSTETDRLEQGFDIIRSSHFRSVLQLLRTIRARGYRRIAIWLLEHPERAIDDDIRLGACLAFQQHHLKVEEQLPIRRTFYDNPTTNAALRRWLEQLAPDALVTSQAIELERLRSMGIQVPRELAFAALHVRLDPREPAAGIVDREECMPDVILNYLERKLRSGEPGLSANPQEIVFDTPFVDYATLPDRHPG